jgi:hypothetical protein
MEQNGGERRMRLEDYIIAVVMFLFTCVVFAELVFK